MIESDAYEDDAHDKKWGRKTKISTNKVKCTWLYPWELYVKTSRKWTAINCLH